MIESTESRRSPRSSLVLRGCAAPTTRHSRRRRRRRRRARVGAAPSAPSRRSAAVAAAELRSGARRRPSASPSTGRRTPTTPGSSSRESKGWYRDAGDRAPGPAVRHAAPEDLLDAAPGRCGISFQDSMTFAVAAGADIVSVVAILQHTASAIAVLADRADHAAARARRQDVRGLRLPERGARRCKAVIKADGGKGDVQGRDARTAPRTRRSTSTRPTSRSRSPPGRASRPPSAGSSCATSSSRDYGFPDFYQVVLACSTDLLAKHPDVARRFVAATGRGFAVRRDRPGRGRRRSSSPRTPACSTRTRSCPGRAPKFLATGGYLVDATGQVGPPDARAVDRATRSSCTTRAS